MLIFLIKHLILQYHGFYLNHLKLLCILDQIQKQIRRLAKLAVTGQLKELDYGSSVTSLSGTQTQI